MAAPGESVRESFCIAIAGGLKEPPCGKDQDANYSTGVWNCKHLESELVRKPFGGFRQRANADVVIIKRYRRSHEDQIRKRE
jgi:ribosomal protein L37AE/L43A